jgi:hypothetical protein
MPRFAEDDDPITEDEWPDDEGSDDDDSIDVSPCPECGERIADDAPQCPHCRTWVIEGGEAARRLRTWFWPALVVLLIVAMLFIWHRVRF